MKSKAYCVRDKIIAVCGSMAEIQITANICSEFGYSVSDIVTQLQVLLCFKYVLLVFKQWTKILSIFYHILSSLSAVCAPLPALYIYD